jgi:hypothetical protein
MCQNFSVHNPLCVRCEGAKPCGRHHDCRPERVAGIIKLEEITGRPLFDINADPVNATVDMMTTSFESENANLVREIKDSNPETYRVG